MQEPKLEKPDLQADEKERSAHAVQQIVGAHTVLKTLRDRLGILNRHPEIEEAITKLEVALNNLSVSTGGMW
jgi:hypothetical protein